MKERVMVDSNGRKYITTEPELKNYFNPDWDVMVVMVEEQQRMAKCIKELEAALAQSKSEPVLRGTDYEAAFYQDWNAGKVRRVSDGKRMVPEREWVGMTNDELLDIADMAYANDLELLQTLQAKLKEKNT